MKFFVFYLQLVNSLEGLGKFFSSAVLNRRFRKHTATVFVSIGVLKSAKFRIFSFGLKNEQQPSESRCFTEQKFDRKME